MPMLEEAIEAPRIRVGPSAPLELMWLLHCCATTHPPKGRGSFPESVRMKFQSELQALQQDGVCGDTEIVVLAQRSGTLLDLDLDRFFASFDAAAEAGGEVPSLLSETGAERRAVKERLRRLQAEPRLLGRQHMWPGRPELDDVADSAAADGLLVLSPGWYFGEIHMIELDGVVYLGRGVRTEDQAAVRREAAPRAAGSLKALADPTRLGILLWLAKHPASVTEIASHFELSQPTVSGHVPLLREAGLPQDRLAGGRSKLIVPRERLTGLFGDAQVSMLRHFPHEESGNQRGMSIPVRATSRGQ